MTSAKDAILGRIRQALVDVPEIEAGPEAWRFRQRSTEDHSALLDRFTERARGYKVRVERATRAEAPARAARILAEAGLVRLALPADFPVDLAPEGFDLLRDDGLDNATIAACDGVLTTCACAIAETGTLVLDHGVGQGRRKLTLLPDYHLCFVEASAILGLVPEAVERMQPSVAAGRPLTFISGPSATSDIELNRVEGVHGPRTLVAVILDEAFPNETETH
ncbi:LutC/YkgG family protein [Lichenihabitans psoromatis]|uniref:LutC/YkgG family protein n=1 Tax=Lichenihabitans psoromatis TaxID=2528642 RepID=UPI001038300B|nr:LUD domain-containing protein [Lichenihabitans psoromatis]